MTPRFVWDPAKDARNRRAHQVSLAVGAAVFADPLCLFIEDERDYDGERRFIAIGRRGTSVPVVVHAYEEDAIALISVRRATRPETETYYAQ